MTNTPREQKLRKILSVLLWIVAASFGWMALETPLIAATAPTLMTMGIAFGAYMAWPRASRHAPSGEERATSKAAETSE